MLMRASASRSTLEGLPYEPVAPVGIKNSTLAEGAQGASSAGRQVPYHLAAAVPLHAEERRVDHLHQRQHLVRLRHRGLIVARPADRQRPALHCDR